MRLSKRLQLLADLITKYKNGDVLADIGTDHAYLPCYLVENRIIKKAYACEVVKGPYESSLATIKQHHLENEVIALLGNGIEPIHDLAVNMIVMAGMGAYLIAEIMDRYPDYLDQINVLFLQPNANTDHLRKYLYEHHFMIIDEEMVKDGHHLYDILVVKKVKETVAYDEYDILFGPIQDHYHNPLFIERWQKQKNIYINIIKDLNPDHLRYQELSQKIKMIEVILNEGL